MNVYLINNLNDFNQYFSTFKESARINSTPNIFFIGFDIEFISRANYPNSFNKSQKFISDSNNKDIIPCLIQIATKEICLLINLVNLKFILPKKLIMLIKNDSWVKVGVGVENDLNILSTNYNLGHCSGGIELKNIALLANINNPNLERLYNAFIGDYVKKSSSQCDWSIKLSKEQLEYAARDAIISYQLGKNIFEPCIINLKNKHKKNNLVLNFVNEQKENTKIKTTSNINYIGELYELSQRDGIKFPIFKDISINDSKFIFQCIFRNKKSRGIGNSKKTAKQMSAKNMLNILQLQY